jgi:hypothetical protein
VSILVLKAGQKFDTDSVADLHALVETQPLPPDIEGIRSVLRERVAQIKSAVEMIEAAFDREQRKSWIGHCRRQLEDAIAVDNAANAKLPPALLARHEAKT